MALPKPQTSRTISRAELAAMFSEPDPIQPQEYAALERLIQIARGDTGQSRKVAGFLLAWWNAGSCGGFDLTELWAVDAAIARDMHSVFGLIMRLREYPDALGCGDAFGSIVRAWRPELVGGGE